jgi:MinD-like ATPase involved in chromosome partitioning or flagellar assembly
MNDEVLSAMLASDELIVVTTPDYVTLSTTLRAIKLAKEKKTPIIGLVVNKAYGKDFELSLQEIEEASGVSVLAVLNHDTDVLKALSECVPSTMHDRSSNVNTEYRKLAAALAGEEYEESGFWEKMKKAFSFSHSVPKQEVNRSVLKNERRANPFYM